MGLIFSSHKKDAHSLISSPENERATEAVEYTPTAAPSTILAFQSEKAWKEHWETNQNSTKLMVIHFTASWCGPCRFIEPVIKQFAAKFTDVTFAKIDIDKLPSVAKEWKVEAVPTFVFVKQGTEVGKVVGANKEELEKKIEEQRS